MPRELQTVPARSCQSLSRTDSCPRWLACRHPSPIRRPARKSSRCHGIAKGHDRYIEEVAVIAAPRHLEALLKVLEASGNSLVPPQERRGLHPLVVPLGRKGAKYTCFLRWPENASSRGLPIVSMTLDSPTVTLLARSVEEYLHRALVEEDAQEGPGPIAAAVGGAAHGMYTSGAYKVSGLPNIDAYLTRKAGMYLDVVEQLVAKHMQRDDSMSALITGEWYMRKSHFPGWGRPFEFNAQLYAQLQRIEEARDSARVGLRMPWWTLHNGFAAMAALAGLPASAAEVRAALEEQSSIGKAGLPPGMVAVRDERQIAMDDAEFMLNRVAAGELGYDDVRDDLAAVYKRAGLDELAGFIQAAQW